MGNNNVKCKANYAYYSLPTPTQQPIINTNFYEILNHAHQEDMADDETVVVSNKSEDKEEGTIDTASMTSISDDEEERPRAWVRDQTKMT